MEIVIISRKRAVGIDEECSGLTDLDYISVLPNYSECIGLISNKSMKMLSNDRIQQIQANSVSTIRVSKKNLLADQSDYFHLYSIANIEPVLYEVIGYNCIINFNTTDYKKVDSFKEFFFKDSKFTKDDFDNLELHTNYLISSYYEGDAAHIYAKDEMVNQIVEKFNNLCLKKCGSKINVEELS